MSDIEDGIAPRRRMATSGETTGSTTMEDSMDTTLMWQEWAIGDTIRVQSGEAGLLRSVVGVIEANDSNGVTVRGYEGFLGHGVYQVCWADVEGISIADPSEVPQLEREPMPELGPVWYYPIPRRRGSVWALLVWCDRCKTVHGHGGGSDAVPCLGHRVAGCIARPGYRDTGYELVDCRAVPEHCTDGHKLHPDGFKITVEGWVCKACARKVRRRTRRKR